jgi:hypothetical protein
VVVAAVVVAFLANSGGKKDETPATGPSTQPAQAPVPADPNAKGKQAFDDALKFEVANPEEYEAWARQWKMAEAAAAGTTWVQQIAQKRADAEAKAERKRRDAEQARAEQAQREREAQRIQQNREEFKKLHATRDWESAAFKADSMGALEGMSAQSWVRKVARLNHLAQEFVKRLEDQVVNGRGIDAKDLDPAAPKDEKVTAVGRAGVKTDKDRFIPWSQPAADAVFDVAKRGTRVKSAEDQLFLAVLGVELGFEDRRVKMLKESVQLVDSGGTVTLRFDELFDP